MKPDYSFIFVNYRSTALLQGALQSLQQAFKSPISAEYLVINNDPSERAEIERLALDYPKTRVIHTEQNLGFGAANNIAGKLATGEILFFINPDTRFMRGNFFGLLEAFHFRPKAVYGVALELEAGKREPWSAGRFPSLARLIATNLLPPLPPHPWRASQVTKTDWVSGAAFAIRHDFFQALGGFDETFFLYFEDVDLSQRAALAGGWVGVYPFIAFQHQGGQSHGTEKEKKQAYQVGQKKYFQKWRPSYETACLSLGYKLRSFF
jgi:GT2 family glycosyltransferase